jgi:hypothetical protein
MTNRRVISLLKWRKVRAESNVRVEQLSIDASQAAAAEALIGFGTE